jgi:hypothetical protein
MGSQWIAFFVGGFLGCIGGMGILSLCVIAGQADRDMERLPPQLVELAEL